MSGFTRQLDELRIALAEIDVLSIVTSEVYDREDWIRPDSVLVERVASLLGLISKSASAGMEAFHRLHGAIADAAPAPATAGERWDYERGTAPGEAEAVSPQDAEIVRRIRAQCPDSRYDGGSDDELIHPYGGKTRTRLVRGGRPVRG